MSPNPRTLAQRIFAETGLAYDGSEGRDGEGRRWLELHPAGHHRGKTFAIRTTVGWRRLDVSFVPGNFAGDLLAVMGSADGQGRTTFVAMLDLCRADGADIEFSVNGAAVTAVDEGVWSTRWRTMGLAIRRGMLPINEGDDARDDQLIELWTSRAAATILALLPVEEEETLHGAGTENLPEGAKVRIEVNLYERDRRNRAAALAIHGYACKACDLQLDSLYGNAAAGLIEVHHVTPVSLLGTNYIINPKDDLVPLCPNCHSVTHRRMPPFSVQELRAMLGRREGT